MRKIKLQIEVDCANKTQYEHVESLLSTIGRAAKQQLQTTNGAGVEVFLSSDRDEE